jgi:hypothetical protein
MPCRRSVRARSLHGHLPLREWLDCHIERLRPAQRPDLPDEIARVKRRQSTNQRRSPAFSAGPGRARALADMRQTSSLRSLGHKDWDPPVVRSWYSAKGGYGSILTETKRKRDAARGEQLHRIASGGPHNSAFLAQPSGWHCDRRSGASFQVCSQGARNGIFEQATRIIGASGDECQDIASRWM